jgi:hypothetical protein
MRKLTSSEKSRPNVTLPIRHSTWPGLYSKPVPLDKPPELKHDLASVRNCCLPMSTRNSCCWSAADSWRASVSFLPLTFLSE